MVGYRSEDPLTTSQKLIAGVVSGVVTRCVTQPVDVIKIRAQLIRKVKRHSVVKSIASKILKEEGIQAFWHGHGLGQVHSILSVSSQFYVFELATKYAAGLNVSHDQKRYVTFVCGVFAGCVSTTLVIPLEVIRVRQVLVHDQYRGLLQGAKNVYKTGGILAFYEGLSASLLLTGPAVGISFMTFRFTQKLILNLVEVQNSTDVPENEGIEGNRYQPKNVMIASTLAGAIAGFVSKTVTYPLDLIKKRLQIGSHVANKKYKIPSQVAQLAQCTKLSQCFVQCYKKEGLRGFFRGWTVTIIKAQLTSVVAFTTYEMLCVMLREINI